MLYDRSLYRDEVFYDGLAIGQVFEPLSYRIGRPDVVAYMESVEDRTPIFLDDAAARAAGFEGALVPPMAILNYGFIYQSMRQRPPTGNLNTSSKFQFFAPVLHGAELTMRLSIEDKFIKRERTYVSFSAVVRDETKKRDVAVVRMELMFPARG